MQEITGSLQCICIATAHDGAGPQSCHPRAVGVLEKAAESSPFYLVAFLQPGPNPGAGDVGVEPGWYSQQLWWCSGSYRSQGRIHPVGFPAFAFVHQIPGPSPAPPEPPIDPR